MKNIYITSGVRKINKQKDKDKTKKIFTKKYEFLYNSQSPIPNPYPQRFWNNN